jgi:hypothetical protein
MPDSHLLDRVKIAVVPSSILFSADDTDEPADMLATLADRGVQVVGTKFDGGELGERIEVYGRSLGMAVIGHPHVERPRVHRFGTFGCVGSDHVRSFVATRLMALDGASIVFVSGDPVPLPLLRTRAAENRVFVAAASQDCAVLIGPDGRIIDQLEPGRPRPIVNEIDLKETADKLVFPGTHIWEQRRPAVYATAFSSKSRYTATT